MTSAGRPQMLQGLRRSLHRQLDPEAWGAHGLSPLNWAILWLIVLSVVFGIFATEPTFAARLGDALPMIDMAILAIFSAEYVARLATIGLNPKFSGARGVLRYALRPASIADLVVLAPLFFPAPPTWILIFRLLRILRLVRLAEMPRINMAIEELLTALRAKRFELIMTMCGGALLLIVSSTALFLVEGKGQPEVFGSVPRALWWAVVTFTTVGYGDAVPATALGRFLAGFFAIAGLALGAMLTGVFAAAMSDAAELHRAHKKERDADSRDAQG